MVRDGGIALLRMTIQASGNGATLKLHGTLSENSVLRVRSLWCRIQAAKLHEGTRVDVTEVHAIDGEGKRLLQAIRESGARLLSKTSF
jgi:ABC-type transporter Mla MlaB component